VCAHSPEDQLYPLGCIPSSVANRSREGILPLWSALVRRPPGVWGALSTGQTWTCWSRARGGHKKDLEHLSHEDRLRELGLFSLERRRFHRDLITAFQYLKGACRKDGDRLFSRACCSRTRGDGFKLKEGRLRLDIRKKLFTMRVVRHWHRLPREAVAASSLAVFKARLDGALGNLVWWKVSLLMAGGWRLDGL